MREGHSEGAPTASSAPSAEQCSEAVEQKETQRHGAVGARTLLPACTSDCVVSQIAAAGAVTAVTRGVTVGLCATAVQAPD